MKSIFYLVSLSITLLLISCSTSDTIKTKPINVEIKDGAYYINGQKTFINALGYEIGARPGQHPYKDVRADELSRMKSDLVVIKEAGYNAIRTWSELTENQVQLVQESGLMLVFGMWLEPDEDFGDPEYIVDAKHKVDSLISWTKNYDCVITYLIMNEPMPEHIAKVGAQETKDLWITIRDIIHEKHPGIPVTISSNSQINAWLNENVFDVYGFNCYDYNDGVYSYIQGFENHFQYLKELNGDNKPVLVTEFGMSVSPNGYGLYGGNTRETQATHIINNYRELLDAGVAGICPFYYADGWWKAGDSAIHDPEPEEWFGYWGYADLNDTIGYPRPIWYEVTEYNRALIIEPRNSEIYVGGSVPVEVQLNGKIARVRAIYNDKMILDKPVSGTYYTDELTFDEEDITDREIVFEFYNSDNELVKYEIIMLLTTKEEIELPKLSVKVPTTNFKGLKSIKATLTIENNSRFELTSPVYYIFADQVGWAQAPNHKKEIDPTQKSISFSDTYNIRKESIIMNIAFGIDIKYGKFTKRIHDQKMTYKGDWAEPLGLKD